jgi:hypothetical protein
VGVYRHIQISKHNRMSKGRRPGELQFCGGRDRGCVAHRSSGRGADGRADELRTEVRSTVTSAPFVAAATAHAERDGGIASAAPAASAASVVVDRPALCRTFVTELSHNACGCGLGTITTFAYRHVEMQRRSPR